MNLNSLAGGAGWWVVVIIMEVLFLSPNQVAASDALKLNWDSKNLGPKVDMPAMSVASVAPARHRKMNVEFFSRSRTDLWWERSSASQRGEVRQTCGERGRQQND